MLRLVQDVVDEQLDISGAAAHPCYSPFCMGEGRKKLPVNQDGGFCVAVKFFE